MLESIKDFKVISILNRFLFIVKHYFKRLQGKTSFEQDDFYLKFHFKGTF